MQDAMDDDALQFFDVSGMELFAVASYRVQRNEDVARYPVGFTIVERDDVGVVIVPKILVVDLQNIFVGAENIGNFTDGFAMRCR